MNPLDVVIVLAVAAVVALCVRSIARGETSECSTCGDAGCTARYTGGPLTTCSAVPTRRSTSPRTPTLDSSPNRGRCGCPNMSPTS